MATVSRACCPVVLRSHDPVNCLSIILNVGHKSKRVFEAFRFAPQQKEPTSFRALQALESHQVLLVIIYSDR